MTCTVSIAPAPAAGADTVRQGEFWLRDYGVAHSWPLGEGAGVTVGVIDEPIDESHPDLTSVVVDQVRVVGAAADNGHGTAVASLLAGHGHGTNNGDGIIGVAPRARLLSIPVGQGGLGPLVRWAVDHGASVINISQVTSEPLSPLKADIAYAEAHDAVIVAGAGNESGSTGVEYPAALPGVVAVTGVVADGSIDHGNSARGPQVAVAAASARIQGFGLDSPHPMPNSGYPAACSGMAVCTADGYQDFGGTSGATPIVAGVAALIRARYPHMNAASVINRIIRTATDKGAPGRDDTYGYGIVNAYRALTANIPDVTVNPLGVLPGGTPSTKSTAPSTTTTTATQSTDTSARNLLIASVGIAAVAVIASAIWASQRTRRRARHNP